MDAKACGKGQIQIKGRCTNPWDKTKDTSVQIIYKHKITKRKIGGAREDFISGRWWLPVHFSKPYAGHFIAGVDRSTTKEGIKSNLKKYMNLHSSGNIRRG